MYLRKSPCSTTKYIQASAKSGTTLISRRLLLPDDSRARKMPQILLVEILIESQTMGFRFDLTVGERGHVLRDFDV